MVAHRDTEPTPISGKVLVIGGNRGLGLDVVENLVKDRNLDVTVVCRKSSDELDALKCTSVIDGIDLTDHDAIASAYTDKLKGQKFDNVVCIAGLFVPDEWQKIDFEKAHMMYQVCCLGPLQLIEGLIKHKQLGSGARIGMITSEGGSIGLRSEKEGGNNYGHHMSKCAQNMMGRLMAWDMKPSGISMVMIHPGFMKTSMTEHYSENYEPYGALPPKQVVPGILGCIERTTLGNTGQFITATNYEHFGMGIDALENPEETLKQYSPVPW